MSELLKDLADEFRKAIPTEDGLILASMIENGVTTLESHIKNAIASVIRDLEIHDIAFDKDISLMRKQLGRQI